MPATVDVKTAAQLLGISTSSAYTAVRNNTFPTQIIKINGRYVVPTKPLLGLLGLEELPTQAA